MSFCPNCGNKIENAGKFCPNCGAPIAPAVEAAPVETPVYTQPAAPLYTQPAAPVYTQPVYTAPVVAEPVVETGTKVKGFVGMGLAIGGLLFAVLGLFYTLIGMVEEGIGFVMAIVFSIFALPLSIIGRSLCGSSAAAGFTSGACSAGRKLGLAGMIVCFVMLFMGLLNLIA